MARKHSERIATASLSVRDLHVYYGASHALQGIDLTLNSGVHAVVGRNGMGKTTLCNTIMGLRAHRSGSIRIDGKETAGKKPHDIARLGVGYTPQGRRLWPSLSVDDHLAMCQKRGAAWTVERIYEQFPRLAERRNNGGAQLSGGEQQMLAIGRALLQDPHLLILDEPTEGLAPVIVSQVEELLHKLANTGDVAILLVEQNLGVATSVADDVAIMVNGQITTVMDAATLGSDRALQQQLLGVGRVEDTTVVPVRTAPTKQVQTLKPDDAADPSIDSNSIDALPEPVANTSGYVAPTRWSRSRWDKQSLDAAPTPSTAVSPVASSTASIKPMYSDAVAGRVILAGTFDTKMEELGFIKQRLESRGIQVSTVDLSTSGKPSSATVPPHMVAAWHPSGSSRVFGDERGQSVAAMADAFKHWVLAHPNIRGMISAGGSGGTALVTPAMQLLSIGIPKVMISTVASGDVGAYVGPSDIMMMYSVTDVQGIHPISRAVLGNGADALAGMLADKPEETTLDNKPAIGLSMFGVTTPAIQQITRVLEQDYECLVFHATGVGGQSMEKLVDSGMIAGAIDLTTTEVCDLLFGGVFAASEDRFSAFARTRIPYIGSVGALDMVNFGAPDTVPAQYKQRTFVQHNPNVTLMRTTAEESKQMGQWIGEKLNQMDGPVRFLLPEGGVSALDQDGQPFYDPQANDALFNALEDTVIQTPNRQLIRHPANINDPSFTQEVIKHFKQIMPRDTRQSYATN